MFFEQKNQNLSAFIKSKDLAMNIQERINVALHNTVQYFSERISRGNYFYENKGELASFFKLPVLLAKTNNIKLGNEVLRYIEQNFLMEDGDFKSNYNNKSSKPEYSEYWTYFNGWILRGAQLLDYQLPSQAIKYYEAYYTDKGALTNKNKDEYDVLSLAHYGMYYLGQNKIKQASKAFQFLKKIFESQTELDKVFYLRVNNEGLVSHFDKEKELFYVVKNKNNQLYFMLAYPVAFLATFYNKTGDKEALDYAQKYMDYLLSCDQIFYRSRFSHKTAWACSILYSATGDMKYYEAMQKIINYFLNTQSKKGLWHIEEDSNTINDQSAEIACWLAEINQNLQSVCYTQEVCSETTSQIC